ncbi:WD40-repeat-containing domain protein, partial [Coemansia spiralis]
MFTPTPERSRPKRAPKRTIAYTIPLPNIHSQDGQTLHQPQGHVLGVNALALSLDANGSDIEGAETATGGLLFSGGRDGVVKAWNLNFPLKRSWKSTARHSRPQTALRASRTMHSNWVNDIVLLNGSKTVVSASSDLTVRAWAPHCPDERPYTIGSHMDYVKALAYSEHRQMVISGGLDRKIKLWDVGEGRHSSGPICALQEFGDASVSSSVYTLACNTQGTLVVSGSPEKFIRIWDTRAGRQLTTLSGHTDHIRAVLLSADSELVLSGSSDTTVKLWSMRMRRCLSTYSHHTDSVWSLYTSHPRFQTFYSASRDGLVAKTVGAGMHADEWMSTNPGVVCVAVAKEPQGVVKLVAADDAYIWTATKGTGLNRWLDVSIRAHHESRQCGVSSTSHQPYSMQAQPRLNSTASALQNKGAGDRSAADAVNYAAENREVVPVRSKPDETIQGQHGLHRHKILPNKRQVLAQDTQGRVSLWDIM